MAPLDGIRVLEGLGLGAAAVFPTGTSIECLVAEVRKLTGAVA